MYKLKWNEIINDEYKTLDSVFEILVQDDITILKKNVYIVNQSSEELSFVESGHKVSLEELRKFVDGLRENKTVKLELDIWDGTDNFAYDSTREEFVVELTSYTSNMIFKIKLNNNERKQFGLEFEKFVAWCVANATFKM